MEQIIRGYSSAGRAPGLQPGGHRFDPVYLHHFFLQIVAFFSAVVLISFARRIKIPVAIPEGSHPFPFRTRKLSPPWLMILGPRSPGKVSSRRINNIKRLGFTTRPFLLPKSQGVIDVFQGYCSWARVILHNIAIRAYPIRLS